MGWPKMRYWLLGAILLGTFALGVAVTPTASVAQVLTNEQPINDGGPDMGDPDQPNLMGRSVSGSTSAIEVAPRSTVWSQQVGTTAYVAEPSVRSYLQRTLNLLSWYWRARMGW